MRIGAVFPEEDSLPGPQLAAAGLDRDAERGLSEDGPDVRGHVVGALEVVDEPRIAVRDQPRGEVLEIPPYGRVGVLADDQRRARVLDEDVAQAALNSRSRDDLLDLPGDLIGRPAATGLDCQGLTVDHGRDLACIPVGDGFEAWVIRGACESNIRSIIRPKCGSPNPEPGCSPEESNGGLSAPAIVRGRRAS